MSGINYVMNDKGKKTAVILPMKDYEKMIEGLDELACIKAYDKVKSRKQEFLPAEEVFNAIEKKRKNN